MWPLSSGIRTHGLYVVRASPASSFSFARSSAERFIIFKEPEPSRSFRTTTSGDTAGGRQLVGLGPYFFLSLIA